MFYCAWFRAGSGDLVRVTGFGVVLFWGVVAGVGLDYVVLGLFGVD